MKIKLLALFTLCLSAKLIAQVDFERNQQFSDYREHQTQQKATLPNNPMGASILRSDTIDVLKYTINLTITGFVDSTLGGNTNVKFTPKLNGVNQLSLDLLMLTIDSIKSATNVLTYNYNDTLLLINLPITYNIGDTTDVTVYYHGQPQHDSYAGGFYFQNGCAYNLGVGFNAQPHNYGRVWFPCFDNFVERSQYEFNITTDTTKTTFCSGYLAGDTADGTGLRTRKWIMEQEIPSYLASVCIGPYTQVNQTYSGINGTIPIVLSALPADTTNAKASFINLPLVLSTFESHFGPYRWNRVGYCIIPQSSFAMEHPTNVSYPRVCANGSLTYQNIYAHELSHHWFGDLATCRTGEDMWLNEGWAHYCEFVFYEALNGYPSYISAVKNNHATNVQFLHVKEGGYQTLSAVPQTYIYGDHVYNKGADVAHTMRSYMGDSLFYASLKTYFDLNQYKDVSSTDFRDALTSISGMDMSYFFDDWVLNPGWAHFSIDSTVITPAGGNYNVAVYVKQKLTGAHNYYTHVPLEITFKAANWTENTQTFIMSGPFQVANFTVPFNPAMVAINKGCKISDAIVSDYQTIKSIGNKTIGNTKMILSVSSAPDSAFVRVEHNFTEPDDYKSCCIPYRLCPNHYWKVDGIFPPTFRTKAVINYEGRTPAGAFSGNYWLDYLLIGTELEDSLVLMYRKNAGAEWAVYPYYSKNQLANNTDSHGIITIDSLQFGEYVFAMMDYSLGINNYSSKSELQSLKLFPNPANDLITVDLSTTATIIQNNSLLLITDIAGKVISKEKLKQQQTSINIATSAMSNGLYFVTLKTDNGIIAKNKFVVAH